VSRGASRKWVVDASVVVKWYVPEPGSEAASELMRSGATLLAPDHVLAEVGNVLWKKVRRRELAAEDATDFADRVATGLPATLRASQPLLRDAVEVATAYDRTVYDALYVALAVTEGAIMLTADERLIHALRNTPLEPYIRHFADTIEPRTTNE
jgi:predicted nucleic acid-binding protein